MKEISRFAYLSQLIPNFGFCYENLNFITKLILFFNIELLYLTCFTTMNLKIYKSQRNLKEISKKSQRNHIFHFKYKFIVFLKKIKIAGITMKRQLH